VKQAKRLSYELINWLIGKLVKKGDFLIVNFQRRLIILLGVISIFIILINGCTYVTPDYDYDSYTVSYIKVTPSSATLQLGSSKKFKILAYDSENNLIPVDTSEVEWGATYECWVCGKVWKLNPESGSLTTYFTPERTGRYYIWGHYKGEIDDSRVDVE
jgi:hypothetical protein